RPRDLLERLLGARLPGVAEGEYVLDLVDHEEVVVVPGAGKRIVPLERAVEGIEGAHEDVVRAARSLAAEIVQVAAEERGTERSEEVSGGVVAGGRDVRHS